MAERIEIKVTGGPPWGFRLQGGGPKDLVVQKIRPKSKCQGLLREGDVLVSVNNNVCKGTSYDDVMKIVDNCGDIINIVVERSHGPSKRAPEDRVSSGSSRIITETYKKTVKTRGGLRTNLPKYVPSEEGVGEYEERFNIKKQISPKICRVPLDVIQHRFSSTLPGQDVQDEEVKVTLEKRPLRTWNTSSSSMRSGLDSKRVGAKQGRAEDPSFKNRPSTTNEAKENRQGLRRSDFKPIQGTDESTTKRSVSFRDGQRREVVTTETEERLDGGGYVRRQTKEETTTSSELPRSLDENERKEEAVPRSHVTNDEIDAERPSYHKLFGDVTDVRVGVQDPCCGPDVGTEKMPGLVNDNRAPLFSVSKFRTESQFSTNTWHPVSDRSTVLDGSGDNIRKNRPKSQEIGNIPPPPPPKLPRPYSADLGHHFSSSSDTTKKETCATERSDDGEGQDRRSASLEMIRKALRPPSEDELKETLITHTKKKMFSSSSFYEEPNAIYPTVREQFDLAKKIATSLSSDTNKKSKGANMFNKRVQRANKWVHESPNVQNSASEWKKSCEYSSGAKKFSRNHADGYQSEPDTSSCKMKPMLNPLWPQDSKMFDGTDREFKAQGLALSPDVCADLVMDLNNSKGKGAAIFAKRRKKSEQWVVDDSNVKPTPLSRQSSMQQKDTETGLPPASQKNRLSQMIEDDWNHSRIRYVMSPWQAALKSPIGSVDAAFELIQRRNYPSIPRPKSEVINPRLPEMLNIQSAPKIRPKSSFPDLYVAKTPKGWDRSFHDPIPTVSSDDCNYVQINPENAESKHRSYNTLPKSWGASKKDLGGFKSVRPPLLSQR